MPRLLILDFGGVCTLSAAELIGLDVDPADSTAAMRDGAEEMVQAAQAAGALVFVLSNELDAQLVSSVPLLQAVDRVVLCSDNGIYKPDRRAFQRCLLLAGVEAHEAMMVDDHPDNVAVAESLGIAPVLFDPSMVDPWKSVREVLHD